MGTDALVKGNGGGNRGMIDHQHMTDGGLLNGGHDGLIQWDHVPTAIPTRGGDETLRS